MWQDGILTDVRQEVADAEVIVHESSRIVVGCRAQALELGPVSDVASASASIVWLGERFAVGWRSPEAYEIRLTNGSSISNGLRLPQMKAELLLPNADASVLWDGERYVGLFANGTVDEATANRDIGILAFSADGAVLSEAEALTMISTHASDERFPIGVSAAAGDYGIAWIRNDALVLQRCTLAER